MSKSTSDQLLIAKRIRALRGKMNQEEFASLLGVEQPTLSRYERGLKPSRSVLIAMAAICDTTVEWILTGKGDQPLLSGEGRKHLPPDAAKKQAERRGENLVKAQPSHDICRETPYSFGAVPLPTENTDAIVIKGPDREIVDLLQRTAEILTGEDRGTAKALRENILSFHEKIEKIKSLEKRIEALEKALNPHDPPGEAKET